MTRLHEMYKKIIRPVLKEENKYTNDHQVPKLEKIVVNACVSEAAQDSKKLTAFMEPWLISMRARTCGSAIGPQPSARSVGEIRAPRSKR